MPPALRYDKALQNIVVTFIIATAVIGACGLLWMREDVASRLQVYRYCLDLNYTPRMCYNSVFKAPKPWDKDDQD